MNKKLKKIFLWSSLGSLALGTTVALTRRQGRRASVALVCRPIPRDGREIVLWTERFRISEAGKEVFARDQYVLQSTHFRLWNVLDLGMTSNSRKPSSTPIYHISHSRKLEPYGENGAGGEEEDRLLERFYGTVAVSDSWGRGYASSCIARGGILKFDQCYVGGSSNGVLSGKTHISCAPVLNYQIEYGPPAHGPVLA